MIPVLGKDIIACAAHSSSHLLLMYSPYYEYSLINEKDEED